MKKGFTLIELLAVIVILAIIALIAVPLIINMIEESREKAAVISGWNYVKAVNYKIAQEALNDKITPLGEYVIGENELQIDADNIENITGSYEIGATGVLTAGLCVNKYSVEYSSGKAYIKKNADYCGGGYVFTEPDAILVSALCESSDADSIYESNDKYKIKKMEDLVCLSNVVNSGKNFSGKEIYLLSDLNISSSSSYKSSTTTKYGDINDNGATEGLLTELTTGAGFKPIGNNNQKFAGTFLGYAYTIDNLMINRTTSYNGLFGYNAGIISGIRLRNINISGASYNGSVAGYNTGAIKNVDVRGQIKGTGNSTGGVVGYTEGTVKEFIVKANIEGNNMVAGVGNNHGNTNSIVGVVYDSTVKSTATSGTYQVGKATTYNSATGVRVSNTELIVQVGRQYSYDGVDFDDVTIASVDGVLDTYIGGDNNEDGYYFDYDTSGAITVYSKDRTPLQTNKLKGLGTEENPYLIRNAKDWGIASATISENNKYYLLTADIDFQGKDFYPLGTGTTPFTGNFNGDNHTISNVNLSGYQYTGIVGYNSGTVSNIYFDNINISSSAGYAGIIGYNTGTIDGIKVRNLTVTGTRNLGGIAGTNMSLIRNVDVQATITGTGASVSGVAGYSEGTIKGFIVKANVEGNSVAGVCINHGNGANIVGIVYDSDIKSIATSGTPQAGKATTYNTTDTVKVSNTTITYPSSGRSYSYDGVEIDEVNMSSIDGTLDSYIGGDTDGDGYYFDYNESGKIEMYSVKERPISVRLSGSGTESNPYLIKNTDDWKMATATINETPKYYKLANDIDFTNKNFYPMGTNAVKFNGVLDGNHNTISNVNIKGYSRTGIIGFNSGTLKNISFNNINIVNSADVVGIVGYNTGTINGVKVRNMTINAGTKISSYSYAACIAGINKGAIKNVDAQGNVTGSDWRVGGIVGELGSGGTVSDFVFKGNVTGKGWMAGAVGMNYVGNSTISGVVYNTTVTSTATSGTPGVGKATTYNWPKNVKVYDVTLNYTTSGRDYSYDGTAIAEMTLEAVDGTIDTTIGGDNDGDGYYFTLTNGEYELITAN